MSHDLDAGLRAGFAALREAEPRRDPAAVVAAANARRSRRRRSRRLRPALALVTATAGRMGEAIAITLRNDSSWPSSDAPWPASVEREIIFDPDTSEVLALSGRSLGSREDTGDATGYTVVQAAGQVPVVGERP
jgi:hypothetical protein